jgi:hypothetical protein
MGEIFPATIKDVIKNIRRRSLGYKPHSLQERRLTCIVFSSY